MAKAACWTVTDTEARKRGEQTLFLSFLMQINPPTFVKNNAAFSTSPFGESAASVFLQNSLLRFSGRKY